MASGGPLARDFPHFTRRGLDRPAAHLKRYSDYSGENQLEAAAENGGEALLLRGGATVSGGLT